MGLMRLGVSNPSANTDVAIYTATGPFLASIIATNKSASVTSNVRIWIVPSGATLTSQYAYLAFDQDIVPQNSLETHRFALNQNDVVYVRADTADMSFMINGLKQVDIALAAGITSYSNTPPLDVMDGMIWVDKDGNGTALNTLAGQVIQSSSASQVPLTIQGTGSQTANILDVKNSAGTTLFSIGPDGREFGTGMDLIASTSTITSGTSIILDNCFTNNYRHYVVKVFASNPTVSAASSQGTGFRLRTGGSTGADFSTNYTYRRVRQYSGHVNSEIEQFANGTEFQTLPYSRLDRGLVTTIHIFNPFQTDGFTYLEGIGNAFHPSNDYTFPCTTYGANYSNQSFTGIKFLNWTGTENFTNVKMAVYGMSGF
jgi:hypothetical protein